MLKTSLEARLLFAVAALAVGACDDDEGPDPGPLDAQVDSGQPDAKVGLDARTDAKVDASADAGATCALDQNYKVYQDGGFVAYHDVYTLGPSGKLAVARAAGNAQPDAGTFGCAIDLPACESPGVDGAELSAAFRAAGVVAAFGNGSTVLGVDSRPVDGQVLVIERADGKKILVGSPCTGSSGCSAIPADVEALRSLFFELVEERPVGQLPDGGYAGSCAP